MTSLCIQSELLAKHQLMTINLIAALSISDAMQTAQLG